MRRCDMQNTGSEDYVQRNAGLVRWRGCYKTGNSARSSSYDVIGLVHGISQEVDPEEHGQMTLYSGCRRTSMMKLRDWLRTGTLGERRHANLQTQKMALLKLLEWDGVYAPLHWLHCLVRPVLNVFHLQNNIIENENLYSPHNSRNDAVIRLSNSISSE